MSAITSSYLNSLFSLSVFLPYIYSFILYRTRYSFTTYYYYFQLVLPSIFIYIFHFIFAFPLLIFFGDFMRDNYCIVGHLE